MVTKWFLELTVKLRGHSFLDTGHGGTLHPAVGRRIGDVHPYSTVKRT